MKKSVISFSLLAGFLSMYYIFGILPTPSWKTTFFDKKDIVDLDFSEDSADSKVALVSNCLLGHYEVYNQMDGNAQIVNKVPGLLSEILNVYAHEAESRIKFYNLSRTQTGTRDFTFYLYHLLEKSPISTIVFSVDYGVFSPEQTTDLASSLEMLNILKILKNKYSDLATEIEDLEATILNSESTQDALTVYGENYQQLLDRRSLTLPRYDVEGAHSSWFKRDSEVIQSIRHRLGIFDEFLLPKWRLPFDNFSKWIEYFVFVLGGSEIGYREQVRFSMLQAKSYLLKEYNNPALSAPVVQPFEGEYIFGPDGEFFLKWLEVFFKIAQKNSKKIVYFLPPYVGMTEHEYSKIYFPTYVRKIQHLAGRYGFPVVDHTRKNLLNDKDLIYRGQFSLYRTKGSSAAIFKLHRQPNIAGKLKLAELLLESLQELKVLDSSFQIKEKHSAQFQARFASDWRASARTVVEAEKNLIYKSWTRNLDSTHSAYFSSSSISPEGYFNTNIYPSIRDKEIANLLGKSGLRYLCGHGEVCGPSNKYLADVFQRIESL